MCDHPEMRVEQALEEYKAATRSLHFLKRLTPRSITQDRADLINYAKSGKKSSLSWVLEPNSDLASERLRTAAARIEQVLPGHAGSLLNLAEGLELAGSEHKSHEFLEWSENTYGSPSDDLIRSANSILERDALPERKNIPSNGVFDVFSEVVTQVLPSRFVVRLDMQSGAKASVSGHTIRVRDQEVFSHDEVLRLVVHEIGTHAFRRANSDAQQVTELLSSHDSDAWTEEGLAVYNEHHLGVASDNTNRIYAARAIAAQTAQTNGIFEVLDFLTQHFEPSRAVDIAIRCKRGLVRPTRQGAFTKDLAYLGGFLAVSQQIEGNCGLWSVLMSAKVALHRLPEMLEAKNRGALVSPEYLPSTSLVELSTKALALGGWRE